jgi:Ser/Thr protein kinase RdoA (MazF antagonist)
MPVGLPALPAESELAALGFANPIELGGGHQSRVLAVDSDAGRFAVKLSHSDHVNRGVLDRRMQTVEALARVNASVVAPTRVCGQLVYRTGDWLVTAVPLVAGRHPDPSNVADSTAMGATLAELHASLRGLSNRDLPRVAPLQTTGDTGAFASLGPDQLLHGDFNSTNILLTGAGPRILDFDACGYGPFEFDVANTLYMVLFDSLTGGAVGLVYEDFRSAFLEGYSSKAGHRPQDSTLDSLIDTRVRALERWVANPAKAPVGVRMSGDAWLEVLRRFVDEWNKTDPTFR